METRRYEIAADGHFMGRFYKAGSIVNLHWKQAKYPLQHGQLKKLEGETYDDMPTPARTEPKVEMVAPAAKPPAKKKAISGGAGTAVTQ